jgi:hypothetical protein
MDAFSRRAFDMNPKLLKDHATPDQRINPRPAIDRRYRVPLFVRMAKSLWRVLNRPVEL